MKPTKFDPDALTLRDFLVTLFFGFVGLAMGIYGLVAMMRDHQHLLGLVLLVAGALVMWFGARA